MFQIFSCYNMISFYPWYFWTYRRLSFWFSQIYQSSRFYPCDFMRRNDFPVLGISHYFTLTKIVHISFARQEDFYLGVFPPEVHEVTWHEKEGYSINHYHLRPLVSSESAWIMTLICKIFWGHGKASLTTNGLPLFYSMSTLTFINSVQLSK